jgi:hypothetical protein
MSGGRVQYVTDLPAADVASYVAGRRHHGGAVGGGCGPGRRAGESRCACDSSALRWSCSLVGTPPGVGDCGRQATAQLGNEAWIQGRIDPTGPFHGYMGWINGYGRCLCLVLRHERLRYLRLRIHAVRAVAWTGARLERAAACDSSSPGPPDASGAKPSCMGRVGHQGHAGTDGRRRSRHGRAASGGCPGGTPGPAQGAGAAGIL